MEEYTIDYDDEPKLVRNASGEPFDRGPQRRTRIKTYTIRKYVDLTTVAAIDAAELTNNSQPLTIKGITRAIDTLWMA